MVIIAYSFEDTNDKDTVRNVSNEFLLIHYFSLIPEWIVIKKAKNTLVTSIVPPKAGIAENSKSHSYNSF